MSLACRQAGKLEGAAARRPADVAASAASTAAAAARQGRVLACLASRRARRYHPARNATARFRSAVNAFALDLPAPGLAYLAAPGTNPLNAPQAPPPGAGPSFEEVLGVLGCRQRARPACFQLPGLEGRRGRRRQRGAPESLAQCGSARQQRRRAPPRRERRWA